MNEFNTYEDLQALFCAEGWGCKCCGKLTSAAWFRCQGDHYCTGCKAHMDAELNGLDWWELPHTSDYRSTVKLPYAGDGSEGFQYAAHMRQEHERMGY